MTQKQRLYGAFLHSEKKIAKVNGVTPMVDKTDKNTIRRLYTTKTIKQIDLDLTRNCLVLQMNINANYNKTAEEIKQEFLSFGDSYYTEYCK